MPERDYVSEPMAESLGLQGVIQGLASDLQEMRAGTISPSEGIARAAVAKQLFNGVRLYVQAAKMIDAIAKDTTPQAKITNSN